MRTEGVRKTRLEQKSETHQHILETAKKLFLEKGYNKTTMRDIALCAKIAIGTIFLHFPDKASLLAATLHKDIDDVHRQAYETLPAEGTLTEILAHPIKMTYSHFARTPELSKTWLKEILFMEGPWGDQFNILVGKMIERITRVLLDAQGQGRLRPDSNCDVLAGGIMSHYYTMLITGVRRDLDIEAQYTLFTLLIESLLFGHIVPGQNDRGYGDTCLKS